MDLVDYWDVLVRRRRGISWIVGLGTLISIIVSLLLPKLYRAEADLLPVGGQKLNSSLAMMAASQIGLGGVLGGGENSNSSQLMIVLKSRTLAERVVERNDLMRVFYGDKVRPTLAEAAENLLGMVSFVEDKKSRLISIFVMAKEPELTVTIANGYVKELAVFINESTLTGSKRNRIFIERQLERNKAELLESGRELSSFYVTNNISNVTPTVDVDISLRENERPKAGAKESLTNTPEVSVGGEASELQRNLQIAEEKIRQAKVVKDIPQQVYLQYLNVRRELLGQINILLTQQYEMAKIEEAKEDLNFQVIDWARAPKQRFEPRRRQIVMKNFLIVNVLAIFYAFFREYLEKIQAQRSGRRTKPSV